MPLTLELAVVGSAPSSRVHVPPVATPGDVRDTTDGAATVFTTRPAESVALTINAGTVDVPSSTPRRLPATVRAAIDRPVVEAALPIVAFVVETSSFVTSPYEVYENVPRTVSTAVTA